MKTFEDKLHESAQRLVAQDNRKMYVPQNPLSQKNTYWGWVATPAAAIAGLIFGLSVHTFMNIEPDVRYVQQTDTLRIVRPVHDTLYLTQIVEKEKIVVKQATNTNQTDTASSQEETTSSQEEKTSLQEETDTPACTSIQCDGINYAILASN